MYKNALADEEAEVKITALMIDGRTGMPAREMAITHGELRAPGPPLTRRGSLAGTVTPIAQLPRT